MGDGSRPGVRKWSEGRGKGLGRWVENSPREEEKKMFEILVWIFWIEFEFEFQIMKRFTTPFNL